MRREERADRWGRRRGGGGPGRGSGGTFRREGREGRGPSAFPGKTSAAVLRERGPGARGGECAREAEGGLGPGGAESPGRPDVPRRPGLVWGEEGVGRPGDDVRGGLLLNDRAIGRIERRPRADGDAKTPGGRVRAGVQRRRGRWSAGDEEWRVSHFACGVPHGFAQSHAPEVLARLCARGGWKVGGNPLNPDATRAIRLCSAKPITVDLHTRSARAKLQMSRTSSASSWRM